MNLRKGITPVIAIVLLLMMTVGAVGGSYVWFSGIMEDAQEEANTQQATELNIYNMECVDRSGNFSAMFWVENTGSRAVDFSVVDVLVYDRFTDERAVGLGERDLDLADVDPSQRPDEWSASDHDAAATEPNQVAGYNLTLGSLGADFDGGMYEIELRLSNTEVSTTAECQIN